MCGDLTSPNLEKEKKHIPNFDCKSLPALIEKNCTLQVGMAPWLVIGGPTLIGAFFGSTYS